MEQTTIIPTNEFQTPIDAALKASVSEEVFTKIVEFTTSVALVKELISPNRRRINEIPRRDNGRIYVDLEKPHILEDMNFFIEDRIRFEKYGYYTAARKSNNPKSDYAKYWKEQEKRSLEGYMNPRTGEWISGYNYWYWNFSIIMITVRAAGITDEMAQEAEIKGEKVRSERVEAFPHIFESDYLFFHYIEQAEVAGDYAACLKCRGVGMSFKIASMGNRNIFLIKKSKTFFMSSFDGYLFEDGVMNKVLDIEAFVQTNTAFSKRRTGGLEDGIEMSYKDKNNKNVKAGYLSAIIPRNTKDPQKARGARGKFIAHEEAGSHKHLITAWNICDKSLDNQGDVFGLQLALGTGGDKKSDFQGLMELFFRPKGYDVHAVSNIFDKNATQQTSGWFIGEYMNRPRSYNSDGVTDIVQNLATIFKKRELFESELDNPELIAQKKAEGAITPLEAITVMEESDFPKELIRARVGELAAKFIQVTKHHQYVTIARAGGVANTRVTSEYKPINDYPYLGANASKAAITIKHRPETHANGDIPWLRYIIGVDTLDDDGGVGSLFAIQVWDLWKDKEVAWYIGRTLITDDEYEKVLCLAMMYNALVNYENNLKGLYGYFKNHNALRYLSDTPQILLDKSLIGKQQRVGNKSKGTRATKGVNTYARQLQANYMRKPHMGNPDLRGIDMIENIEWLREAGLWDPLGNFDMVSASGMTFILREDLIQITESSRGSGPTQVTDYEEDSFFDDVSQFGVSLNQDSTNDSISDDFNF